LNVELLRNSAHAKLKITKRRERDFQFAGIE